MGGLLMKALKALVILLVGIMCVVSVVGVAVWFVIWCPPWLGITTVAVGLFLWAWCEVYKHLYPIGRR